MMSIPTSFWTTSFGTAKSDAMITRQERCPSCGPGHLGCKRTDVRILHTLLDPSIGHIYDVVRSGCLLMDDIVGNVVILVFFYVFKPLFLKFP